MRLSKFSIRFLAGLLAFAISVLITLVVIFLLGRSVSTRQASQVTDRHPNQEVTYPEGWKELNIKGRVTMGLPQDMKPAELLGDSFAYREAYGNRELYLIVVYGEISPNRDKRGLPFDACETPSSLLNQPTYQESVIDIDGRKGRLGIDRHLQSEYVIANLCLHPDEKGVQLILSVNCKDDRALQTARQIFTSIRFKE